MKEREEKRLSTRYIELAMDMINNRFPIQNKNWIQVFVIMVVSGIVSLCLYNYFADPYNYFSKEYNEQNSWGSSQYYKARYVLECSKDYDCFIIGGSNSNVLNPEVIDEYTDYKTYSMSFAAGNWYSYYVYSKFLIENANPRCIILHLSSTEFEFDEEYINDTALYRPPAIMLNNGFENVKEEARFLLMYFSLERAQMEDPVFLEENGMAGWSILKKRYDENPDEYVMKYVLNDYETGLSELENVDLDYERVEIGLNYAKQIKQLCADNSVELVVICGPVFISKRSDFECDAYYDYLKRLTDIVDIYDFSDITDVNANPYNFHNSTHYNGVMGEKVIDAVFGNTGSELDGVKLTAENINEYIWNRKEKFQELLEEYRSTGTIQYQSYDSESRIREQ